MKIRFQALAIGAIVAWAVGFGVFGTVQPRAEADHAAAAPVLAALYALPAEVTDEHVLLRGETLSELFDRAALGSGELSGVLLALREHIDPRRLLPNTRVLVRRWYDDGSPRAVDVVLNSDSMVRLSRGDMGWSSELQLVPTTLDTVVVSGVLPRGGSLYTAMVNAAELDLPRRERETLVYTLAHIYGWEINFASDMHPGDGFRVIFERDARPDGTSREVRVLIAEVVNQGRSIPAIYFEVGGEGGDYYGPDGRSLRLAFNRYPVDFPRITSNFNWQRYHPILQRNRPHLGTDFGTGYGAPVKTTADGTISFAAWDGGYGNLIRIDHGNGYETRYAHLSRFAPGIRRSARVRQGQVIGYTGATGLATAPHLHYEFRHHGRPVDVRTVRLPAAPPVPPERMAAFQAVAQERSLLLAQVPPAGADTVLAD
jgi:murein DD-endopeptidase MepM/ murein hydrolase activator NlpD